MLRVVWAFILILGALIPAQAQVLRPGDSIGITVFQDSKLDRQLVIGPTGMIGFPLAGQIRAAGLTPGSLESLLKERLKDKYAGDLDITVSLLQTKQLEEDFKPRIFITGEVLRPGTFVMRTRTNIMQGIALAGGFGPFAAKHRIQVRRQIAGSDSIFLFDYDAFFRGTNLQDNIDLRPGDVIIVPEKGLFE